MDSGDTRKEITVVLLFGESLLPDVLSDKSVYMYLPTYIYLFDLIAKSRAKVGEV